MKRATSGARPADDGNDRTQVSTKADKEAHRRQEALRHAGQSEVASAMRRSPARIGHVSAEIGSSVSQ